jgi:V/A-type H+-transporting ATPase subunit I
MSIIGSFVHPTRLILLEFFGRFYEAGGIRYQPFGFRTERVEVIRDGGK